MGSEDIQLRRQVTARIEDPDVLFRLARSTQHPVVQLRAAAVLADRHHLERLLSDG